MRVLIAIVLCLSVAVAAMAEKPYHETAPIPARVPCGLTNVIFDWDFANGDQGFTTGPCDAQGVPVWEHGTTAHVAGAPGTVWGTVLEADYPTDSGEALSSPSFGVDIYTYLLEVTHYYDAENLWDGGNVKVNGQEIAPLVGYPGMISVPGDWYAWCVDLQMGFTGLDSGWITSCFDLSPFIGEDVVVSFEFGSDDTFVEAGWYLAAVRVGNDETVPVERRSFGEIKGLYR